MFSPAHSLVLSLAVAEAASWIEQPVSSNELWYGITSSDDGNMLAAISSLNYIWTSSDSGINWVRGIRGWQFLANFEAYEKNQSSVIFVRNDGHSPFSRASPIFS